jgi:hypothetical protein
MEVDVIFDPTFQGHTGKAVWIIETPANRTWFDAQRDLDPNSAIFSVARYSVVDSAVLHVIWSAQEHHPAWERIEVTGVSLTPSITAEFNDVSQISATSAGFRIERL